MANHIYGTAEFSDILGVDYKLTIRKMVAGTDSTKTFHVGAEGFVHTYETTDEFDVLTPVMGSTVEFTMMYEDADRSYFAAMFTDILSGEDGLFALEVHRDQDSANTLWWRGYILPEAVTVEDIQPYEQVTIRATDGLGALDAVDFDQFQISIRNNIIGCLNELPYIELYGGSDNLCGLVDDFLASNSLLFTTDYSNTTDSFSYLRIDEPTWYNNDNEGTPQYYSRKTFLESVCKTFNARLYQWQGLFYLMPLGALQDGSNIKAFLFDKSYTSHLSSNLAHSISYGVSYDWTKMRGWVQTALPPHGEIKIERNYQGDKPALSRANLALATEITDESAAYEAGKRFRVSGNFLYRFTGISTGNTDNNRYGRIVLKVKLQVGDAVSPTTLNYYISRPYSLGTTNYIHASGDQYDNDFANTLELGADQYGEIEWTNDVNNRYQEVLPFIIDRQNGTGQTLQDGYYVNKQFTFVTPEIPADKNKLSLTIEAVGIQADGTTTSDYLNTTYAEYQLRNIKVQYTTETQEQEFGTVEIKATANGRYDVDLGTTLIGDRIATENYGIIKTITATGYEEVTDWRSRNSTTTGLSINKLAVNERMGFYKNGKVIQRGTLLLNRALEYIAPHSIVTDGDNSYDYFVSTLRHVAASAQYDVTLVRDGRNISGVTLAQDNSKPSKDVTANDPGNVPNSSNIKGDTLITNAFYNYNKRARSLFAGTWTSVIGSETKEMYWTITNDGMGRYFDYQGETPTAGYQILRKVYVQTRGLQSGSDSGWTTPTAVQPNLDDTLEDTIVLIQEFMSKVDDHGAYTFMVTYSETVAFTGLLDTYTGATAAYSLRRLTINHTGSLIRIRRASDNAETDIGFDSNGDLDESAITTFAGGSACYVVTFYDQSGNALDMTQVTTGQQPQIYTGSVFYSIGAGTPTRKAMLFATTFLRGTGDLHSGSFYAASAVVMGATIGNSQIFCQDDAGTGGAARVAQYLRTGSANNTARVVVFDTGGGNTADNTANNTVAANNAYVIQSSGQSGNCEAYVDNVSDGQTSVSTPLNHGSTTYTMGSNSHSSTPGAFFSGRIAEVVIWDGTMSASNRSGIQSDIETYYTI